MEGGGRWANLSKASLSNHSDQLEIVDAQGPLYHSTEQASARRTHQKIVVVYSCQKSRGHGEIGHEPRPGPNTIQYPNTTQPPPKLRRWDVVKTKGGANRKEQRRQTGTKTECAIWTNRNRTHSAWLIREGDHDLSLPISVREFVPLFLWCTHIVKIGCESDPSHVDIIAHVVRDTVTAAFRFVGTEVTLKRDFRVSRDIAGTSHTR